MDEMRSGNGTEERTDANKRGANSRATNRHLCCHDVEAFFTDILEIGGWGIESGNVAL